MDRETLTLLLRGQHLSMPDCTARGLWPHPPLLFSDLVQHLAEILREETYFPNSWRPHEPGQMVPEGGVIEKRDGAYLYRCQRASPMNPIVLAEKSERIFPNAEEAACHYLRWDLHPPGDLDGWKVLE